VEQLAKQHGSVKAGGLLLSHVSAWVVFQT
jgi:hypothetical protein